MAKKVVASVKNKQNKHFAKIIRCKRSPKTGAYTFRSEIVPIEQVDKAIKR